MCRIGAAYPRAGLRRRLRGGQVPSSGSEVTGMTTRRGGMTTRRVAWRRSDEVATDEHCTLTVRDGGLSLVGTVLGAEGWPAGPDRVPGPGRRGRPDDRRPRPRPARLRAADDRARARCRRATGRSTARKARALKGCTDVDLGCSPSTNTLPIRRLGLGIGEVEDDPGRLGPVPGADRGQGARRPTRASTSSPISTRAATSRPSYRSTTTGSSGHMRSGSGPGSRWAPTTPNRSTRVTR